MFFLINLFNHNATGQRSLEDVIGIIAHQLRALGHSVEWSNRHFAKRPAYNLIVEGFTADSVALIKTSHETGHRFIYIATEEPTPKGFNHGISQHMIDRQAMFPEAAKYADAVLSLVPGAEEWFGQYAPCQHIELGHASSLERPDHIKSLGGVRHLEEPTHDFGFFGSLSVRRDKILRRLAKTIAMRSVTMSAPNAIRVMANFSGLDDRDRAMRSARVLLQIRLHERMGLVSSSRCNTSLHIGRPVVAEPHLLSAPWDQVVHFSKTSDSFFDDAIRVRATWQSTYDRQMERFRDIMSPRACIGEPLDRLAIAPMGVAA